MRVNRGPPSSSAQTEINADSPAKTVAPANVQANSRASPPLYKLQELNHEIGTMTEGYGQYVSPGFLQQFVDFFVHLFGGETDTYDDRAFWNVAAKTFVADCPIPVLRHPDVLREMKEALAKTWEGKGFSDSRAQRFADLVVTAIARQAVNVDTSLYAWRHFLRENPDAFVLAPPEVLADRLCRIAIVRADPWHFAKQPVWQDDENVALAAIIREPGLVGSLSPRLRTSIDFWNRAVRAKPSVAKVLTPQMQARLGGPAARVTFKTDLSPPHPPDPRRALSDDERAVVNQQKAWSDEDLAALPPRTLANPRLALALFSQRPNFRPLPDALAAALPKDDKFWLALIAQDRRYIVYRPELAEQAAAHDPLIIDHLPQAAAAKLLRSPALCARYDDLSADLAAVDIEFPDRFARIEDLYAVMRDWQSGPDGRPLAVVVFPKRDFDHAFEVQNPGRLSPHYRVLYVEAETDTQVLSAFADAAKQEKISFGAIAGHGAEREIGLGEADRADSYKQPPLEPFYLDALDAKKIGAALSGIFTNDATLLVDSCSTGSPSPDGDDMVQVLHTASGVHTVGPRANGNGWWQFDAAGRFVAPGYFSSYLDIAADGTQQILPTIHE